MLISTVVKVDQHPWSPGDREDKSAGGANV